nr:retrotransposon protein Ty1-copia subclass [Tanacetum cinerariifolium]
MMGNRALLTNFVEKFLGTVRFGNNNFAVIAGYGDVVIGTMTIKKVYYVEGLGHNLFSVGQFYDKGLEVAFRKSTCFVRNEDGVDLLTGDHHLCSACEQWKIHQKHHKSKTAFASNKPLYLLHMDLCGPMRIQNINGKRYVLVVLDDYSWYTWIFFFHSKDEASEVIISFIKKTQVNLQLQVQRVRTDNGTEFKNKTLAKFFDEVGFTQQFSVARTPQQIGVVERRNRTLVESARTMLTFANHHRFYGLKPLQQLVSHKIVQLSTNIMKSSTTNVETPNIEEVFHEVSESFQGESSSSSLNNDVQHSPEEANPNEHHVSSVKRILHYLKGTINLGFWYPKYSGFDLTAYSDADHAGCLLDRKKSEYIAVSGCCAQVLWRRTQLTDYGFFYDKVPIYCDSKSAIAISCNPVQHTHTKHIDV